MLEKYREYEIETSLNLNSDNNSRYVDMLTRTETAIANVQGTINRWIQVWLTKFRVIEHFDCCSNICSHYNGEVFDVSKGMVNLPPYHPNCRGYIEAVIDWHDWGYHKELERKATYLWEWEFWPVYKWLKNKEAEDFLLAQKKGEVKGAYSYKMKDWTTISIDAFYWKYDKTTDNWFWVVKLKEKHPEVLGHIQEFLDTLPEKSNTDNRIKLYDDENYVTIWKKRFEKDKKRIITAYKKKWE